MRNRTGFLAAFALASAISARSASAQACSAPYFVEQRFPTTGTEETRWKLCWQVLGEHNLVITGAWFRPAPTAAWIKLIFDARVSQMFVVYHNGQRYNDVGIFGHVPISSSECTGQLLGTDNEMCKEVRDRGLVWKYNASSRRGQELVIWSVMKAGSYLYVIEWTFRDDGTVIGRVGATGQLHLSDAHVHGPVWRLDLDLNGSCCNGAALLRHSEGSTQGSDTHPAINNESGWQWSGTEFSMLEIHDQTLRNANGKQSEWHLIPNVSGIPFHGESWTKSTFWVTRFSWSELLGNEVMNYTNPPGQVSNNDIVLWYYAGLHHMIRDEDTDMTHLMWTGFMLKPANVWSKTSLYP
jgi:hypothetical protein